MCRSFALLYIDRARVFCSAGHLRPYITVVIRTHSSPFNNPSPWTGYKKHTLTTPNAAIANWAIENVAQIHRSTEQFMHTGTHIQMPYSFSFDGADNCAFHRFLLIDSNLIDYFFDYANEVPERRGMLSAVDKVLFGLALFFLLFSSSLTLSLSLLCWRRRCQLGVHGLYIFHHWYLILKWMPCILAMGLAVMPYDM